MNDRANGAAASVSAEIGKGGEIDNELETDYDDNDQREEERQGRRQQQQRSREATYRELEQQRLALDKKERSCLLHPRRL